MVGMTRPLGMILLVSCLLASGCILPPAPAPEGNATTHTSQPPLPTATVSPTPWWEGDHDTYTSGPSPSPTPYVPPEPLPKVFLVHYTIVNDANESRSVHPGPHCSNAYLRDGIAWILEDDYRSIEDAAAIMVTFPRLEGRWGTIGTGAMAHALPAWLDPDVEDHDGPLPHLTWNASAERLWVDGQAVVLPHERTFHAENDTWHMEIEVSQGPDRIQTWRREQACI